MKRWGIAVLILAVGRRLLRGRETPPGLGRVGRQDGYSYRYATRRRSS